MLAAFVIVFREVFEAGLVVGVVLAATRSLRRRGAFIAGGVTAGFLGACLVAAFAGAIADLFDGAGQETLNAAILVLAVAMLTWHNAWMASHGRELAATLKGVGRDVTEGRRSLMALSIVCAVAVLREGSEVVLFLYGVAASGEAGGTDILAGGSLGVLAGASISALLYLGLIAIPLGQLFRVLTGLVTLLAAGLAAQAVRFLEQGGWITGATTPLWDSSRLLSEDSWPGRILHVLVGYADRPSGAELLAYLLVIAAMLGVTRIAAKARAGEPRVG